jgi:hypothetical protein
MAHPPPPPPLPPPGYFDQKAKADNHLHHQHRSIVAAHKHLKAQPIYNGTHM